MLALDVPSGLDSDTGNVVGAGVAVRATHTVTFIAAKPGLYTGSGRDYAGEVSIAPIGVTTSSPDELTITTSRPAALCNWIKSTASL